MAHLYDEARAGHPAALYDDVMAAAGLASGDPMLEISRETDKATEDFVRRGLKIAALEPGQSKIRTEVSLSL